MTEDEGKAPEIDPKSVPAASERSPSGRSRRQILAMAGGLGVAGAALLAGGTLFKKQGAKVVQKLQTILPLPTKALPPLPADPALTIPGLTPLITPSNHFFQIDTATSIPSIDISSWRLTITGMVKNPITLTYSDLLKRPLFELDDTLSCVSNPVGGFLVGNARWLGCRLDDLIKEAGPLASADQLLSRSEDDFTAGFPLANLDGRDAMIAVGMNGAPLPPRHGYPARIIVPGLYGYVSATKWLTSIEITRFDAEEGYWISRGWSRLGPIKMESRIDLPADGATVDKGATHIAGVAWAPNSGVKSVEVKIDGGPWLPATLGPQLSGTTWRQWWLPWDAVSGSHTIVCRATNANGEVQTPTVADVAPNGASGWHSVQITV